MRLFNKTQLTVNKKMVDNLNQANKMAENYIVTITAMQTQLDNMEKSFSEALETRTKKITIQFENAKDDLKKAELKIKKYSDQYD